MVHAMGGDIEITDKDGKVYVDEKEVTLEASFIEDLGADSLDLVELIMSLEEEFSNPSRKVEIPDDDAEKILTVQDAVDYLKDLDIEGG